MSEITSATSISGGEIHAVACSGGEWYGWGSRVYWILGDRPLNAVGHQGTPTALFTSPKMGCIMVSAGNAFAIGTSTENQAVVWGIADDGRLGHSPLTNDVDRPRYMLYFEQQDLKVEWVSAGPDYALVITTDGKVFAWGSNSNGKCGTGTTGGSLLGPVQVTTLAGTVITRVSAGYEHALALDANGIVYAWGLGANGRTGVGSSNVPVSLGSGAFDGDSVRSIAAGECASFAVTETGNLYSWGCGLNYMTGLNTQSDTGSPTQVDMTRWSTTLVEVSASRHGLAIDDTGRIYGWGNNHYGQCGSNHKGSLSINTDVVEVPNLIPGYPKNVFLHEAKAFAGAAGPHHSHAIRHPCPGDYCINGECSGPNQCSCDAGWTGDRCDTSSIAALLAAIAINFGLILSVGVLIGAVGYGTLKYEYYYPMMQPRDIPRLLFGNAGPLTEIDYERLEPFGKFLAKHHDMSVVTGEQMPGNELTAIAENLVFIYEHHDESVKMLGRVVSFEVVRHKELGNSVHVLFRQASMAHQILIAYARTIGIEYLIDVLGPAIEDAQYARLTKESRAKFRSTGKSTGSRRRSTSSSAGRSKGSKKNRKSSTSSTGSRGSKASRGSSGEHRRGKKSKAGRSGSKRKSSRASSTGSRASASSIASRASRAKAVAADGYTSSYISAAPGTGDEFDAVSKLAREVFQAIITSMDILPLQFRQVCRHMKKTVEKHYKVKGAGRKVVADFLMLRFFLPALLDPVFYGLLEDQPTEDMERLLKNVVDVLMTMTKNRTFAQENPAMAKHDKFIAWANPKMNKFLDRASSIPATEAYTSLIVVPPVEIPEDIYYAALHSVYGFVYRHQKRVIHNMNKLDYDTTMLKLELKANIDRLGRPTRDTTQPGMDSVMVSNASDLSSFDASTGKSSF